MIVWYRIYDANNPPSSLELGSVFKTQRGWAFPEKIVFQGSPDLLSCFGSTTNLNAERNHLIQGIDQIPSKFQVLLFFPLLMFRPETISLNGIKFMNSCRFEASIIEILVFSKLTRCPTRTLSKPDCK